MKIFGTDDPIADFERYDAEQQKKLSRLPRCCCCGEPIQDDFYFDLGDEIYCEECLKEQFRKSTEDWGD
jgi:formylmethanofuran dehydrogenase subunit E